MNQLKKQINADINLLYRMAIAGRYSALHIENIKRKQKILGILEQLMSALTILSKIFILFFPATLRSDPSTPSPFPPEGSDCNKK